MKKVWFLVLTFLLIFSFKCSGFNFEVGFDLKYSNPMGDFLEGFQGDLGYGLEFVYPINPKIKAGIGYSQVTLKAPDYDDLKFKEDSLSIFGQYYFYRFKKFDLYALGKISYNQQTITMFSGEEEGNVGGFGLGIKCKYDLNEIWVLNAVLSFDVIDKTNRINLVANINYKYTKGGRK